MQLESIPSQWAFINSSERESFAQLPAKDFHYKHLQRYCVQTLEEVESFFRFPEHSKMQKDQSFRSYALVKSHHRPCKMTLKIEGSKKRKHLRRNFCSDQITFGQSLSTRKRINFLSYALKFFFT